MGRRDTGIRCGCGGKILEVLLSRLIFLIVSIVIYFLQVQLQGTEAFRDYTRSSIQDTAQIRLSQLLPVLKGS